MIFRQAAISGGLGHAGHRNTVRPALADGKATLSRAVAQILNRLGSSADHWHARLEKLRHGNLLGRFFATSRQRLRAVAERLGLRRVPNLGGCPAP
jgi:hypothetical protein